MVEVQKIQLLMRALARPLRTSGSRLGSQSGQAVIEYILILVVTIAILLGVMYQFNSAFKKYVQAYFGEYVACLLETGEMPSLGGGDGISAEICNASFEPFSLKNGRPFVSSDSSNSDSGGRNGGSSKYGSSPRSRNGRLGNSKVTKGMLGRNGESKSGSSGTGSESDDKKRVVKRYVSSPSYNFRSDRLRSNGQIPLSGKFTMGMEKKEEKAFTARIDTKGAKGGSSLRAKKLLVEKNRFRKIASNETSLALNLSFSDYIRYLIIFGLVVMIIVFFGGQLLQLRKGYDAA